MTAALPPPAAARTGLMRDGPKVGLDGPASTSAPGELRGALGRLGYSSATSGSGLCARGAKAMFVAAADLLS